MQGTSARRLLLEKLPLLAMVAASCMVTLKAQSGAIAEFEVLGFWTRLANATISYGRYLWMMLWPADLAVFYPLVTKISYLQLAAAIPVLAAATVLAFRFSGGRRYVVVGWLWYIVTLVPVIGLVQVGSQSHADRYTYIPSVGIFLIAVWGAGEFAGRSAVMRRVVVAAGLLVFAAMGIATHRQAAFWKEDLKLFTRAITVTKNNAGMLANAGVVLSERGYAEEGLSLLQEAARLQPKNVQIVMNLGSAFVDVGRFEEAAESYRKAIELRPDFWDAQLGVATALAKLGRPDEADVYCRRAMELAPDTPDVYNTMGMILVAKGKLDESIEAFTQAAEKFPGIASARLNLARVYAVQGRLDDAIAECRKSIAMLPHQAAYDYLAELLEKNGQAGQAAAVCEEGLKKFPEDENLLLRRERLSMEQYPEKNKPKDSGPL